MNSVEVVREEKAVAAPSADKSEQTERNRRASSFQSQGDLALTHRKFREASEYYSKAMQVGMVGSDIYLKVRDKLESVTHILVAPPPYPPSHPSLMYMSCVDP